LAVAQGFSELMKGLVPERRKLITGGKLTTRGSMVMVLRMVSLNEGVVRKNYDQMRLIWMASSPDKTFHIYP
jgi:hypothetical protein